LVLIEGCAVQIAGLAMIALAIATFNSPGAWLLMLVLTVVGFGQGVVMAPLSGVVLSTVKPESAGSGSGMYGTTAQIANAAGIAAAGALFFAVESASNTQHALFAALTMFALSIIACVAFLSSLPRRAM
jgi:predicted MFS family arabinose efflux permease